MRPSSPRPGGWPPCPVPCRPAGVARSVPGIGQPGARSSWRTPLPHRPFAPGDGALDVDLGGGQALTTGIIGKAPVPLGEWGHGSDDPAAGVVAVDATFEQTGPGPPARCSWRSRNRRGWLPVPLQPPCRAALRGPLHPRQRAVSRTGCACIRSCAAPRRDHAAVVLVHSDDRIASAARRYPAAADPVVGAGAQAEGDLGRAAGQPAVTRVRNGSVGGRRDSQVLAQAAPAWGRDGLGARTAGQPVLARPPPGQTRGEQQGLGAGVFLGRGAGGAGPPGAQRIFQTPGDLRCVLSAVAQGIARDDGRGAVWPVALGRVVHGGRGMRRGRVLAQHAAPAGTPREATPARP